jgi:hypothetical protein
LRFSPDELLIRESVLISQQLSLTKFFFDSCDASSPNLSCLTPSPCPVHFINFPHPIFEVQNRYENDMANYQQSSK